MPLVPQRVTGVALHPGRKARTPPLPRPPFACRAGLWSQGPLAGHSLSLLIAPHPSPRLRTCFREPKSGRALPLAGQPGGEGSCPLGPGSGPRGGAGAGTVWAVGRGCHFILCKVPPEGGRGGQLPLPIRLRESKDSVTSRTSSCDFLQRVLGRRVGTAWVRAQRLGRSGGR